jgi:hypothetical protein
MSDTQVFGRNHAMQEMLGKAKDGDFLRLAGQLVGFQREIQTTRLSEDQSKCLIKLCNELVHVLNKGIMTDDTSSRISSASSWLLKERTSNPED